MRRRSGHARSQDVIEAGDEWISSIDPQTARSVMPKWPGLVVMPDDVGFVDSIPHTATGKIEKRCVAATEADVPAKRDAW